MTDRLKTAFDGIRADDKLKADTLAFLRAKARPAAPKSGRPRLIRLAAALACLCIAVLAGVFSYRVYFAETVYVDVDINPSLELAVNRFGRVIGVSAYNADGESLLSRLDLMHLPYGRAVNALTEAAVEHGFLTDGGLVSVTVQANGAGEENTLVNTLRENIQSTVRGCRCRAQVDVFPVDSETRACARGLNLSPAKYLAILELQKVDPSATFEGCRPHSIGELQARTRRHGAMGGGQGENAGEAQSGQEAENSGTGNGNGNGGGSGNGTPGGGRNGNGTHGNGGNGNGNGMPGGSGGGGGTPCRVGNGNATPGGSGTSGGGNGNGNSTPGGSGGSNGGDSPSSGGENPAPGPGQGGGRHGGGHRHG